MPANLPSQPDTGKRRGKPAASNSFSAFPLRRAGWAEKILHAGLALGDSVLEGCDAGPGESKKPQSFGVMVCRG